MFLHFTAKAQTLLPALLRQVAVCALIFASAMPVTAGTIYKTVDKDGNTIFTDRPLEGAEAVKGKPKPAAEPKEGESQGGAGSEPTDPNDPTVDAFEEPNESIALTPEPTNPPPKQAQTIPEEPTKRPQVTVVEILTPIHDTTLHDPYGKIWVELQSYPTPLKKSGLTAELWMDDKLIAKGKRPMLSLPAPERGTHVLQVKLVDDQGRLFLESDTTNIHVKVRTKRN